MVKEGLEIHFFALLNFAHLLKIRFLKEQPRVIHSRRSLTKSASKQIALVAL